MRAMCPLARAASSTVSIRPRNREAVSGFACQIGCSTDALLAAKSPEWRNEKHRAQWAMTLDEYAKLLRALPVDEVDTEAVLGKWMRPMIEPSFLMNGKR